MPPKPKPPSPDAPHSLSELCKLLSAPNAPLTQGKVAQAIKEGFVTKSAKGLYSLAPTLVGLVKYLLTHHGEPPIYENVGQCSSETGIPLSLIKSVRRGSKSAFIKNRIHLLPLLKEIFERTDGDEDWKKVREKADAEFAVVRAQRAKEETVSKDDAGAAVARAVSAFWFSLDRVAEIEAPADLKGCSEVEIRQRLIAMFAKVKQSLREDLIGYIGEVEEKTEGKKKE